MGATPSPSFTPATSSTGTGETQAKVSFGIGARLAVGFGAIVLVLATVSTFVALNVNAATRMQDDSVKHEVPAMLAAQDMLAYFNRSRAILNEFLLNPEESVSERRRTNWTGLGEARDRFATNSQGVRNGELAKQMAEVDALIATLDSGFREVERIAQTTENQPGLAMLAAEAEPLYKSMFESVSAMIDEEKALDATPERKALLGSLADARGHLANTFASLRAYMLSGDRAHKEMANAAFLRNATASQVIGHDSVLLTEGQKTKAKVYSTARQDFEPLIDELCALRESDRWNIALAMVSKDLREPTMTLLAKVESLVESEKKSLEASQEEMSESLAFTQFVSFLLSAIGALIGIAVGIWVTRTILTATRKILAATERVANGDFTRLVEMEGSDEMARIGGSLDVAITRLRDMIGKVRGTCEQVGASSTELSAVARQMKGDAGSNAEQAGSAAAGASQVNASVQSVAAASEELSQSIQDISRSVSDVTRVASDANRLAGDANSAVERLGQASGQIGDIVKLISSIAEQTNLLALNATIEAARAGEAGKGFAVVATEVKELANETGKATGQISSQITAVQTETRLAIELIGKVADVIRTIHDTQTSIAGAVEEQNATTGEISRNVTAAAEGTTDIEKSVQEVARNATSTLDAAGSTETAAEDLSRMAEDLREMVSCFRV
jgi:methyl-accepting chemotaxis protein